jgi:uncharacterized protein (TIGR00369 family)
MTQVEGAPTGGFLEHVGFRLIDWSENFARLTLDVEPHHFNVLGITHGGVILTALDYACGISGCYRAPPGKRALSVTISLATNFVKPLTEGRMVAEGRVVGGGRTIFFAESKITDSQGNLIATASGAFKRITDRK